MAAPNLPDPPSARELARASLGALAVALLVLTVAVLPAEYGIDPTGIGRTVGFTRLHDARAGAPAAAEDPGRLLYSAEAAWTIREVPLATLEGLSTGLSEQTHRVMVNLTNLTAVTARLQWRDEPTSGAPAPDVFVLRVLPPLPDRRAVRSPAVANDEAGHGNVSATFPWRPDAVPREANGTVAFPLLAPDPSGVGEWRFEVWLQEIGGAPADPGNAWRLHVAAQSYALHATIDAAPRDTVRLTLPPGGSVEYKFRMARGAAMDYRWTSDAPVYGDLHGDRPGAADAVQYRAGTQARDEGSFTAAFDGRHGWYWRNDGAAPAHLTLSTRGDYDILGVV